MVTMNIYYFGNQRKRTINVIINFKIWLWLWKEPAVNVNEPTTSKTWPPVLYQDFKDRHPYPTALLNQMLGSVTKGDTWSGI